jgi:hypothetical protein
METYTGVYDPNGTRNQQYGGMIRKERARVNAGGTRAGTKEERGGLVCMKRRSPAVSGFVAH